MHPHQIISVDQEQTVKDEKETIVIRKISVHLFLTQCEIVCIMRFQRVSKILTPHRMLQKT